MIAWQRAHGRRELPWQGTRDPYRIWLSEIMLQQTQVAAVIPYYERFLRRFPTVEALAKASEEEVLELWSGLGYYARGRNLHRAARAVASRGAFPGTSAALCELPGVGRSTAAAIAAFAFGERAAILDGNVKRVLARYFGVHGFPGEKAVQDKLWSRAEALLPARGIEIYTQALMDLGATVCTRNAPRCDACPVHVDCVARRKGQTDRVPAPRPRKATPSKSTTWLVLRHAGQVLLERRPSSGLWGGLWSFPEVEKRVIPRVCLELGCTLRSTLDLQAIEHAFTHFRLTIQPVLCEVGTIAPRAESGGRLWLDLEAAREAATPAPVRRLLQAI